MIDIPAKLQRLIIERARNRCEYCRLSQAGQEAAFHIDHITPVAASRGATEDSLALAVCPVRSAREHGRWQPIRKRERALHFSILAGTPGKLIFVGKMCVLRD